MRREAPREVSIFWTNDAVQQALRSIQQRETMSMTNRRELLRFVLAFMSISLLAGFVRAQDNARYVAHFRPVDHALGDVHPFFHDGTCYLYYLKPDGYHAALVISSDLLSWKPQPLALDESAPANHRVPYYVLGVFADQESAEPIFRTYYGQRGVMYASESHDLIQWRSSDEAISVPGIENLYRRRRDPFVFWNEDEARYWCVMTTQLLEGEIENAGAISFATSTNLHDWKNEGLLLNTRSMGEPECPQMFKLGEYWYLLASEYDQAVGQPTYRFSRSPRGSWETAETGLLDGKDLCAAQVAFDGSVWVLMGWIPDKPAQRGNQTWGGHLALPRELFAEPDGRLGCRLHHAISEAIRGESLLPQTLTYASDGDSTRPLSVTLPAQGVDIDVRWKRSDEASSWKGSFSRVVEAVGEVNRVEVLLESNLIQIRDDQGVVWSELPLDASQLPSNDSEVEIRLLVDRDILEVHVSKSRSIVARVPLDLGETHFTCETVDISGVDSSSSLELDLFRLRNVVLGE